jgi:UDP-glucose 4-epimerase
MFKNKVLLITGGTGSFGNAVLGRFLNSDLAEIRIFSRDEKKQEDMRIHFKNDKIKFYIGDVRNFDSISDAMRGVDYVFHAAALKQVPSCEFYPMEAVQTNILGAENVMRAAMQNRVKKCVVLSTDKAVYPINAMGMTKALMEKVSQSYSRNSPEIKRYQAEYVGFRGTSLCFIRANWFRSRSHESDSSKRFRIDDCDRVSLEGR